MSWTLNQSGVMERMLEQDGKLIVSRSQDIQALIDQNKAEADVAPSMFWQAAVRKIRSIPFVIAEQGRASAAPLSAAGNLRYTVSVS